MKTKTAQINVKIDLRLKEKAQKVAAQMGLSLSAVVNRQLQDFIRQRRINFVHPEEELEPSDYLMKVLEEVERDKERKDVYSFADSKKALAFLDKVRAGNVRV